MGQYHMASNPSCVLCTSEKRSEYEERFFSDGSQSDAIAEELGIKEATVYHHMKHHFQPLVQRSAATEVAITVGNEINVLRDNVGKLNGKLAELMDEGSVHDEGFVRNAVTLHKEVRRQSKTSLRCGDLGNFREMALKSIRQSTYSNWRLPRRVLRVGRELSLNYKPRWRNRHDTSW